MPSLAFLAQCVPIMGFKDKKLFTEIFPGARQWPKCLNASLEITLLNIPMMTLRHGEIICPSSLWFVEPGVKSTSHWPTVKGVWEMQKLRGMNTQ